MGGSSVEVEALTDTGRVFLVVFVLEPDMRGYLAQAVEGIRTMVSEQRGPGDRIAVATCSGGACRLVLGPSTDEKRILVALDVVSATLSAKPQAVQQSLAALYGSSPKTMVELANAVGLGTAMLIEPGIFQLAQRSVPADPDLASVALAAGTRDQRSTLEPGAIDERLIDLSQRFIDSVATDREILAQRALASLGAQLRGISGEKHLLLFSQGFGGFGDFADILSGSRDLGTMSAPHNSVDAQTQGSLGSHRLYRNKAS